MNAIITYFRESVEELHKVRWPTRRQAVRLASIVLVFMLITSLIFGFIDVGLAELVRLFLGSLF